MANIDSDQASMSDIRAVARVGNICGLFGPPVVELTAADVAERTGLNRTTAYRYCASMVAAGILQRGSRRGTFALGGLMMELGLHALGRQRVTEIAGPHLRALSTAVRLTAVLSVRGAQGPVVAHVEEHTSSSVVVTVYVGTKLDTTAAQTQVFLAYGDDATMDLLAGDLSTAERRRLESDVRATRRHGYSAVEHADGSFGVAAPVFDEKGLCATVGLLGAGELPDPAPGLDTLLETAAALNEALGAPREGPASADI